MSNHTKGELVALSEEEGVPYIRIRATRIGESYKTANALMWFYDNQHPELKLRAIDEAKANARRLVACWNACASITTEDLEAFGVSFPLLKRGAVSRQEQEQATTERIHAATVEQNRRLQAENDNLKTLLETADRRCKESTTRLVDNIVADRH